MNKNIVIAIIVSLGLIGYALINNIFQDQREEEKRTFEKQKIQAAQLLQESKERKIQNCVAEAHIAYTQNWNDACKNRGLAEECMLPAPIVEYITTSWREYEKTCYQIYD